MATGDLKETTSAEGESEEGRKEGGGLWVRLEIGSKTRLLRRGGGGEGGGGERLSSRPRIGCCRHAFVYLWIRAWRWPGVAGAEYVCVRVYM